MLLVAIVHYILPMNTINQKIFKIEKGIPNEETYNKATLNFITNYEIQNPATTAIGL